MASKVCYLLLFSLLQINGTLSQSTYYYRRTDVCSDLHVIDTKLDWIASKIGFGEQSSTLSWMDCKQILDSGHSTGSGIYQVYNPIDGGVKKVYYDMDTDYGGWMVIQRRIDGRVNFSRNWEEYRAGFGDLDGNLWLGNEFVNRLTAYKTHSLRVDLESWKNETKYAMYNSFAVDSNEDKFKLTVAGYTGTAGDSLISRHSGMMFTTYDKDNDILPDNNCAVVSCPGGGGWWFSHCEDSFLNGRYVTDKPEQVATCEGLSWDSFRGEHYSLMRSEMKIRPNV